MDDIQIMKLNIDNLQKENISLKNTIQLLKEKENSYQSSISRIKQLHNEYESIYTESLNDYKKHEEEIKQKFSEFQKNLEKNSKENEKRLTEEILLLKNEIKEKDDTIVSLNEKINLLNEKITKEELNIYFKEKEYEDIILAKDRKLGELNEAMKQIVQEATVEIKRLSEQLEDFQNRIKLNNPMNMNMNILLKNEQPIENNKNDANNNNNILNKSFEHTKNNSSINNIQQNNMNKQSQNLVNNSAILPTDIYNNYNNILKDNNNIPQNKVYNTNPNTNININANDTNNPNSNIQELMTQLYMLQNDKVVLNNQLKQKEKEVNFWKNLRSNLHANAQAHPPKNILPKTNSKTLTDLRIKNMEKNFKNYGIKTNTNKKQYDESLKIIKKESDKFKNDLESSMSLTQNSKTNEANFNTHSYFADNDENENKKF